MELLAQWKMDREKLMHRDVRRARDLIRLWHTQSILADMSAKECVQRIIDWQPPLEEMRRHAIEREVALAIYRGWPGTADMVCAPEWRESFAACAELVGRLIGYLRESKSYGPALDSWAEDQGELEERAIGPDWELIDHEEAEWRLLDYGDPLWSDERLWRDT